jgi:exopolysaccharide biosynthesis WecB/TagA/CpsF family protein
MSSIVTRHSPSSSRQQGPKINWPAKYDLFGVRVAATDYDEIVDAVSFAALTRVPATVSLHAVHAIIEATRDPRLLSKVNQFDAVLPDGQPVRWALNHLHGLDLPDRVCGPELMLRICARAAADSISIYLYGSTPQVLDLLQKALAEQFPGLRIAGVESPPFRALTPAEDADVVRRINESGAGIVFIGLGCPKQDHFAADHSGRIWAVQICVGAAFEFHAGTKTMAPKWMQRRGLEWVYRLACEPRRLFKRYLTTNTAFLAKWLVACFRPQRPKVPNDSTDCGGRHP